MIRAIARGWNLLTDIALGLALAGGLLCAIYLSIKGMLWLLLWTL